MENFFANTLISFIFLFFFIQYTPVIGQENYNNDKFNGISIRGFSGAHLYGGKDLTEKVNFGYAALDVRFSWQPNKENEWTRDTGFASYGVGFFSANIGDPEIFGNPNALYGFVNFYLSNPMRKNVFEISPAFGLTYNLNPYNPENNPLNDAIGARMAVYFNMNFGAAYRVNREIDFLYGIDFTHFSNGRTFTPNYGLNLFGFNIGMRYNFNRLQKEIDSDPFTTNVIAARFKRPEKPKTDKNAINNSLDIYLAVGTVQNDVDKGTDIRYGTFSGVVDYRRYFNKMHGLSAGMDVFYDNSLIEDFEKSSDRYLVGVHGGYDFMFWKFDVRIQIGGYLTDSKGKESYYIRPALQYEISKDFFAQVGLKTRHGGGADWIEFGLGWKPFKW